MANLTAQMTVVGNMTRDPELRFTQAGQAVASFSLASTPRTYNKETKQYEDGETLFTNCSLWGKPAENLAASAKKGTRVIAAGQFKSRSFKNREGEQKTVTELVIDEIGLSLTFASYGAGGSQTGKASAPIPGEDSAPAASGDDETPW